MNLRNKTQTLIEHRYKMTWVEGDNQILKRKKLDLFFMSMHAFIININTFGLMQSNMFY